MGMGGLRAAVPPSGSVSASPLWRKARAFDLAFQFAVRNRVCRGPAGQTALGAWTRERLVSLGPTYVKLGQIASVRAEMFSAEFLAELESLQDAVPAMSAADTAWVLAREIPDHAAVFEAFDLAPHKAASLGQVHRARLAGSGLEVCVKLQRRGVAESFGRDAADVTDALEMLNRVGVNTGASSRELLEEAFGLLRDELDYGLEAANARRFYGAFRGKRWFRVPRVLGRLSTPRALTMEWVPGVKLTDATGLRGLGVGRRRAMQALLQAYTVQLLEVGFFHADPHPGNMAITAAGELVVYDYGIVVDVPPDAQARVAELIACAVRGDARRLVDVLLELGIILPGAAANRESIVEFLQYALDRLLQARGGSGGGGGGGGGAGEVDAALVEELSRAKPFDVPVSFLFLTRSAALVQATCVRLDPDFDVYRYLQPRFAESVAEEALSLRTLADVLASTAQMPARVSAISESVSGMRRQRAALSNRMESVQRSTRTLTYAMAGLVLANAVHDWDFSGLSLVLVLGVLSRLG